jgi:hypothetical protein
LKTRGLMSTMTTMVDSHVVPVTDGDVGVCACARARACGPLTSRR